MEQYVAAASWSKDATTKMAAAQYLSRLPCSSSIVEWFRKMACHVSSELKMTITVSAWRHAVCCGPKP